MISNTNYPILIDETNSLFNYINEHKPTRVAVLTDTNTEELCLPAFYEMCDASIEVITIPPGEHTKQMSTCYYIWQEMMRIGMDRHSLLINLGGGVIGDMGGFCAATYMRGIPFIQIPTTLLSQVDSSVGGKLGVDLTHHKNMIGVFADPKLVLIYPLFLATLPYRELLSGFAEMLKHALIMDKSQWQVCIETPDIIELPMRSMIAQSVQIKANVVDKDPFEKGLRKILNFGHTVGHAVESEALMNGESLLHGEAIAIGMICESHISWQKGLLPITQLEEIAHFLTKWYGNKSKLLSKFNQTTRLAKKDKKNIGGSVRMSLIDAIGSCLYDIEVSDEEIENSLEYYQNL